MILFIFKPVLLPFSTKGRYARLYSFSDFILTLRFEVGFPFLFILGGGVVD